MKHLRITQNYTDPIENQNNQTVYHQNTCWKYEYHISQTKRSQNHKKSDINPKIKQKYANPIQNQSNQRVNHQNSNENGPHKGVRLTLNKRDSYKKHIELQEFRSIIRAIERTKKVQRERERESYLEDQRSEKRISKKS